MAILARVQLNLADIPKEKIYKGKKGQYLTVVVTLNDTPDQYGFNGPVYVEQTKEERDGKAAKQYLGNAKVVWTDGTVPAVPERTDNGAPVARQAVAAATEDDDLPF
ncbi:MAG: hypothetical protein OEV79_12055 [candidate division WOR-3 bacterium]|nr:hypothetical protein [candidate division WOR-3 bacterium]